MFSTFYRRVAFTKTRCLHTLPSPPTLLDDLNARGLVAQVTSPNLAKVAANESLTVYLGVDPTARSLHAGNLLALMSLLHFHIRGHSVIALIGGATGSIGDPGGRSTERPLLSQEALDTNIAGITSQAHRFFDTATRYASKRIRLSESVQSPSILNNISWLGGMGLLEFLRLVGKHAKVNVMIKRDSVRNRLESEHGISFTEFSYQLLQAYDFHVLNQNHNCRVQLGGSDQWGNITSGIDLIRRRNNLELDTLPSSNSTTNSETLEPTTNESSEKEVFGLTTPLLLTSSGAKFGKSAGNAVWLDKELTSYLDLYQFFMHVTDEDVPKYLQMFTLLSPQTIKEIVSQHQAKPELRSAQKTLAAEVVEMIHGEDAVRQAEAATAVLFTHTRHSHDSDSTLNSETIVSDVIEALSSDPRLKHVPRKAIVGASAMQITKLAVEYGLTGSRGEARKLLQSGGLYLNNLKLLQDRTLDETDLLGGRMAILRGGKDRHIVLVGE